MFDVMIVLFNTLADTKIMFDIMTMLYKKN